MQISIYCVEIGRRLAKKRRPDGLDLVAHIGHILAEQIAVDFRAESSILVLVHITGQAVHVSLEPSEDGLHVALQAIVVDGYPVAILKEDLSNVLVPLEKGDLVRAVC